MANTKIPRAIYDKIRKRWIEAQLAYQEAFKKFKDAEADVEREQPSANPSTYAKNVAHFLQALDVAKDELDVAASKQVDILAACGGDGS